MVLAALRALGEAHERLKKRIHATRIPLSKNGQRFMGLVYFSVPIIGGLAVMRWAQGRAEANFALEEDKIRQAAPSSTVRHIQRQNEELRRLLQESTTTSAPEPDGAERH